jgi:hypothetical protein
MRKKIYDQKPYLNKRTAVPYKFTDFTHPDNIRHVNQYDIFCPNKKKPPFSGFLHKIHEIEW